MSCQKKGDLVSTMFPMFFFFLYFLTSQHYTTHTHTTRMSLSAFLHTRTSALATDRDHREIMPEQG